MAENSTVEIIRADLLEHPAVKAWSELGPERAEPERIEILREGRKKKWKSTVYRLEGVGPAGSAVIAKRCRQATAVVERTIYEEILPHLPLTVLRYYGFVEQDGQFCWLFIEDAGDMKYSPLIAEHRAVAAQWLGLMHTSASRLAAEAHLPDRGPGHYLESLQSARDTILQNLVNPNLTSDDVAVLESIVSQCEVMESHWSQVERFCEGMPRTLVHGDFVGKNVRVRIRQADIVLLPFDWETAGWGVPAADLIWLDHTAYWSTVRNAWLTLDVRAVQGLADIGKLFRCLAAIGWEAPSLAYEWVEGPMRNLRIHASRLADVIRTQGWED
jgi:hypothetical protein